MEPFGVAANIAEAIVARPGYQDHGHGLIFRVAKRRKRRADRTEDRRPCGPRLNKAQRLISFPSCRARGLRSDENAAILAFFRRVAAERPDGDERIRVHELDCRNWQRSSWS